MKSSNIFENLTEVFEEVTRNPEFNTQIEEAFAKRKSGALSFEGTAKRCRNIIFRAGESLGGYDLTKDQRQWILNKVLGTFVNPPIGTGIVSDVSMSRVQQLNLQRLGAGYGPLKDVDYDDDWNVLPGHGDNLIMAETTKPTQTNKGEIMNKLNNVAIETRTYVYGQLTSDVSDDEIFDAIADVEADIAKLEKISNQPEKLVAKIEGMKADIAALVKHVDGRKAK